VALTVKQVERIKDAGRFADGHGLYLEVTATGARSWTLRYQRGGRERWMGLGPTHTYGLDEARELARRARQQIKEGVDPIDARRAQRAERAAEDARTEAASVTFAQCVEAYHKFHSPKWTNRKHVAQFLTTMRTHALPTMGKLPVAAIDKTVVIRALEKIWYERTSTASRIRGRIEAVLDFAKVRGYRDGENPAAWDLIKHALPAPGAVARVAHHAALPYAEVGAFFVDLRARDGIAARALEFCVLTATRSGEVRGATWQEVDAKTRIWTVPPERTKTGKEHRVPLSDRAVEILEQLPREADFVFVGPRPGAPIGVNAMADVLRVVRPEVTVHGFRSTFRDWAAETTSYPNHVVEMALAHAISSEVEKAYRRGDLLDKRRKLMQAWSVYCDSPVATGNVTPIRKTA
jgi:integrase